MGRLRRPDRIGAGPVTAALAYLALALAALAAAAPARAQAPRPADRTATARPAGPSFAAAAFGAIPDDGIDDIPAVAAAVAAAKGYPGATVRLPGGTMHYAAPLHVGGTDGVRIVGATEDGPATTWEPVGYYAGPLYCVGLGQRWAPPAACRPSAAGVFDASIDTTATPMWGVAVTGANVLTAVGHPLQLGARSGPSYDGYGGTGKLCVEAVIRIDRRSPGYTLLGIADANYGPAPWKLVDGGDSIALSYLAEDGEHRAYAPLADGLHRVTVQLDTADAYCEFWIDRQLAPGPALLDNWPAPGRGRLPGQKLARGDGFAPFSIGATPGTAAPNPPDVAPFTLFALKVCRSNPYVRGAARQTFAGAPGVPVNDAAQFFTLAAPYAPELVAALDITGRPDLSWVPALSGSGKGCLFWSPPLAGATDTKGVEIAHQTITTRGQPGVLVGTHLGLTLDHLTIGGGAQAIGAHPTSVGYPTKVRDCQLSGDDAGGVFWHAFVSARDNTIGAGRHGLRLLNPNGYIRDTIVNRIADHCQDIILCQAGDNGSLLDIDGLDVDDEGGALKDAVVKAIPGHYAAGNLILNRISYGYRTVPYLKLVATPAQTQTSPVTATNLTEDGGDGTPPVAVEGKGLGWVGSVEGAPGALAPKHAPESPLTYRQRTVPGRAGGTTPTADENHNP